jgi:hypothetical protein
VRALLLDLDDTLLDYSGGVEQCWAGACADGAPAVPQVTLVAALAETRRTFWRDPEHNRRQRVDMLRAWTSIATLALERWAAIHGWGRGSPRPLPAGGGR